MKNLTKTTINKIASGIIASLAYTTEHDALDGTNLTEEDKDRVLEAIKAKCEAIAPNGIVSSTIPDIVNEHINN